MTQLSGGHCLDLARQLAARGLLARFYTVLPASRTEGIPPRTVQRNPALGATLYASMRGWLPLNRRGVDRFVARALDRWVSRNLVEADVAHAVQGLGRHTRVARRRFGSLVVCDATTSHFGYLKDVLTAEHAIWRAPLEWDDAELQAIEEDYAESDLILAPSRFVYETFVARGVSPAKIAVVPYGVDTDVFRPVPAPRRTFRILFVGVLSIRKGLPYLLEALAPLRWPHAELVLRGSDDLETAQLLAGYRGTIPITRVPPMPRARLKELYSDASVLVLPSVEDAFGLVITQALACGTPVIATTHTGGPDVIEHGTNGFIVPPADPPALREALTVAYEDRRLLDHMRAEARQRVEAAGGWTAYGDAVVDAWSRAIDQRPPARPT